MNVGPLADISSSTIRQVRESCKEMFDVLAEQENDDEITDLARLAVAATGGHLCVKDQFFFDCRAEVLGLKPKGRARWKQRCDDARGTRRNVIFYDGMLRVRDDTGRMAPLVPSTISCEVNEVHDVEKRFKESIAPFVQQRYLEMSLHEAREPPSVNAVPRRRRAK